MFFDNLWMSPEETEHGRVLVVDDEPSIVALASEVLTDQGFEVQTACTARSALAQIRKGAVDLLLSDVRMPGEDGLWLLRVMRSQHPEIPVVMMTGLNDSKIAVSCLREGAADYLCKPLALYELSIAVRRALREERVERENRRYKRDLEGIVLERTREMRSALKQKEEACSMLLEALVQALDAREQDTHNHSLRVASYTAAIMREIGAPEREVTEVYKGALLHDVGKIGIPDAILLKPGPLTDSEWQIMRTHPDIGARILDGIPFLSEAREIVLSHHERWDGMGYPRGLEGDEIPLGSRVFAVADTLDAMTTHRPYRAALPLEVVEAEVKRCSGSQFDPEVSDVFLQMVADDKLRPRKVLRDAIPEDLRSPSFEGIRLVGVHELPDTTV